MHFFDPFYPATGVFVRTSTLPDDYLYYYVDDDDDDNESGSGTIADGWYNLVSWNHDGFAALQVRALNNNSQTLPAIYDKLKVNTSIGINIHHNYGSTTKRHSEGCITVFSEDWNAYLKNYKSDPNKAWTESDKGQSMGKLFVERCIDIVITETDGTIYSQYADCGHVLKNTEEEENKDPGAVENIFKDIKSSSWYVPHVQYAYDNEIMQGTGGNTFEPDKTITRAEFVQAIYNMEGNPTVRFRNVFSDVKSENWFADAVIWAYENEIVSGYPDGSYGVNKPITREEMALILMRYSEAEGFDMTTDNDLIKSFPDDDEISDWAVEGIGWAVTQEVMNGKGQLDGSALLDPKGKSMRSECATMLSNVHRKFK